MQRIAPIERIQAIAQRTLASPLADSERAWSIRSHDWLQQEEEKEISTNWWKIHEITVLEGEGHCNEFVRERGNERQWWILQLLKVTSSEWELTDIWGRNFTEKGITSAVVPMYGA